MDMDNNQTSELNLGDYVIERYPKRSRKNKIEDLSLIDEPDRFINKAEKLSKLPYPIDELVSAPEYEHDDVISTMPVQEFTLDYIRRNGLNCPLFFDVPPEELGMRMPDAAEFTIMDVLELVGGSRKIEVVEVYEQKGSYMLLEDFVNYYNKKERSALYNVLSLEFTSTKLAEKVSGPAFVSQIDWIDNVWPKELFKRQEDLLQKSAWARDNDFSTYPKVQRYCLMSVANCFTDFHIDFGGTSVWYHILKGEKIFWLIEPSETNLRLYEEWILNGTDNSCFFGKLVNKCARVWLRQGHTLIIPSGWIHCVYTPVDSLVFGGNFLHSYSIPMQIRVAKSEDRIRINSKYRFPHFKQMFWCFIAQMVRRATRRIYQKPLSEEAHIPSQQSVQEDNDKSEAQNTEEEETNESKEDIDLRTADGEEICYDEQLGNNIDGSPTFNPIQSMFDRQDRRRFTPPEHYDLDYLRSLSGHELNAIHFLVDYTKRLLKSKQPEVIEGITRPHHLVADLQALLAKIIELNLLNYDTDFHFTPKENMINGFVENIIPEDKEPPTSLTVKLPPKMEKRKSSNKKRQSGAFIDALIQKKSSKKGINQPATSGTILVDGLPLATHQNMPAASGFNPLEDVFKLGQKPMQSAWRKSSDMAKPPPPTHIQKFKNPLNGKYMGESSFELMEADEDISPKPEGEDEFSEKPQPTVIHNKEGKKISHRIRSIPQKASHRILEVHDESPEFIHRSPLQRIKGAEVKCSTDAFPVPVITSSTSRNEPSYRRNSFNNFGNNRRFNYRNFNDRGSNRGYSNRGGFNRTFNNNNRDVSKWGEDDGFTNSSQTTTKWGAKDGFSNDGFSNTSSAWGRDDGYSKSSANFNQRDHNNSKEGGFGNYSNRWKTEGKVAHNSEEQEQRGESSTSMMMGENQHQSDNSAEFYQSMANPTASKSTYSQSYDSPESELMSYGAPLTFGMINANPLISSASIPLPPNQPMSIAVNELHHISQIMDTPDYVDLDQIPLPSEPPSASPSKLPFSSPADESCIQEGAAHANSSSLGADPFADVEQLANITKLMQDE